MIETFESAKGNIHTKLITIGENLLQANELILDGLADCEKEKFFQARNYIKNIGAKTDEIDNEIIKLLGIYTPEGKELRECIAYLKITNELSRACSNTRSFIRGFSDVCDEIDNSKIKEYTVPMHRSTLKAVSLTLAMMNISDPEELQECYDEIIIEESKADDLYEIIEHHIYTAAEYTSNFEKYHKMLKAVRKSEKIAYRAIGIANLLLYMRNGGSLQR